MSHAKFWECASLEEGTASDNERTILYWSIRKNPNICGLYNERAKVVRGELREKEKKQII